MSILGASHVLSTHSRTHISRTHISCTPVCTTLAENQGELVDCSRWWSAPGGGVWGLAHPGKACGDCHGGPHEKGLKQGLG